MKQNKAFAILALAVLFVPLVFSRFTFEKFETVKLVLLGLLAGLALLAAARELPVNRKVLAAFGLLVFGATFATILSPDKAYSLLGSSFIWFGWLFLIIWSLFVVLLAANLNRERVEFLLKLLVFTGLINGILSLLQAYGIGYYEGPYTIGYLLRPPALMGNANYTAMFLAAVLPMSVYFTAQARSFYPKLYFSVSNVILVLAVMILSSRGAILGMFAALAAVFILSALSSNRRLANMAVTLGLLGFIFYSSFTAPFRATYTSPTFLDAPANNVVTRIETWDSALEIIKQHPLFGIGFGNLAGSMHDPHNLFLHLTLAGGLVTVLAFTLVLSIALVNGLRQIQTDSIYGVLIAALAGFLVSSSFNPVSIGVWLVVGVVVAALLHDMPQTKISIPKPAALAAGALVILLAGSFALSELFLYRGLKANVQEQDFAQADAILKTALVFNPFNELALRHRAGAQLYLGNTDPRFIEKYLSLHPKDPEVLLGASRLYFELFQRTKDQKYFDRAIASANEALTIDPWTVNGNYYLAWFYYSTADFDKAKQIVSRAVSLNPRDQASWMLLTNVYLAQSDWNNAALTTQKLYELDIKNKVFKHLMERLRQNLPVELMPLPNADSVYEDFTLVPTTSL